MKKLKLLLSAIAFVFAISASAQDIKDAVDQFNKGSEAYNAKNYAEAITNLEAAYNAVNALGDEAGDEGETIKSNCKNLIPDSYSSIGESLAQEKKYTEALDYFNKATAAAEKYGSTDVFGESISKKVNMIHKAQSLDLAKAGEITQALELAGKTGDESLVGNIKKLAAQTYLKEAAAAQKEKKYPTVIEKATQALEYNPQSNQAYLMIGLAHVQSRNFGAAITNLEKGAAVEGGSPVYQQQIYYYLGVAYQSNGNNAKACQNYKKVEEPKLKANAQKQIAVVCK